MLRTTLYIFLCILTSTHVISATLSIGFCLDRNRQNVYVEGSRLQLSSVFRTKRQNTLSKCLKSCISISECEAFSFDTEHLICTYGKNNSLFETTPNLYIVSSSPGWISEYYEALIHPCTHQSCPYGYECIVLKSDQITCIAHTECIGGPGPGNSTTSIYRRTIGQTVQLTCDAGYTLYGKRTCSTDGKWADVLFSCEDSNRYQDYQDAVKQCISAGGKLPRLETTDVLGVTTPLLMSVTDYCTKCPVDIVVSGNASYISSDNYTGNYPNNQDCICRFVAEELTDKILFKTESFQTERNYDYLWIADGLGNDSPVLGKFDGNASFILVTNGPYAHLRFVSDASITDQGFNISYWTVPSQASSNTTTLLTLPDQQLYFWLDSYRDIVSELWLYSEGMPLPDHLVPDEHYFDGFYNDYNYDDHKNMRICYDPFTGKSKPVDEKDHCHIFCILS